VTDQSKPTEVFLFKFGKREHLEALRREGLVYISPQTYFTELEADSVRSDRFEGVDIYNQPDKVRQLTIQNNQTGEIIDLTPHLVGPVLFCHGNSSCSIYCMFGITEVPNGPIVDVRNFAFGDSYVVVLNTQVFIDRVRTAIEKLGTSFECGFVEYFDEKTYSGDIGPFRKPSTFSYQNEFRIVVRPGAAAAVSVRVGDLRDITTEVMPLAEINRMVEIVRAPGEEACGTPNGADACQPGVAPAP
jgi:hypothetical protein